MAKRNKLSELAGASELPESKTTEQKNEMPQQQWTAENAHLFPGAALPSFFANRFQVLINNGMARLAFGESLFGEIMKAQVVVSMTMPDAKEMARLLEELITQIEGQAIQGAPPDGETPNN